MSQAVHNKPVIPSTLFSKKSNLKTQPICRLKRICIFAILSANPQDFWWGGWVAETSSLLNCRTRKGSGGSNPPLTAKEEKAGQTPGFLFLRRRLKARFQGWESRNKKTYAAHKAFSSLKHPPRGTPSETRQSHHSKAVFSFLLNLPHGRWAFSTLRHPPGDHDAKRSNPLRSITQIRTMFLTSGKWSRLAQKLRDP